VKFITMEFIEGRSAVRHREKQKFPPEEAVEVIQQFARHWTPRTALA